MERLEWEQVEGEWREVAHDAQDRSLRSGAEPVRARLETRDGGVHRVLARVKDDAGRANETELRVWVAGGRVPPSRDLEEQELTLVPDRREYRAGDLARILVVAPFAPAEGVLTLRRSGLLREERFTMASGSHTLEIPVEDGFTPNVHVQVDLVGRAPRDNQEPASRPRCRAARVRERTARPARAAPRAHARARGDAARRGARARRRDRARPRAARCRGPAGRGWRGGRRGGGRGRPRAHRVPRTGSPGRLLRRARPGRRGLPAALVREARGSRAASDGGAGRASGKRDGCRRASRLRPGRQDGEAG